jgi:hypothetical protein
MAIGEDSQRRGPVISEDAAMAKIASVEARLLVKMN